MADEDLIKAIDSYESTSIGSNDLTDLGTHRALAIDAYGGKNIEPAPEGRSQVIDWTVFETIQWMLPSLTRIFCNGDVVDFEPVGLEDEAQAKQEAKILNWAVTKNNKDWFLQCLTWFQDALLTKNAYMMVEMQETKRVETDTYKNQTLEAVQLLLQEEGAELVAQEEFPDPNDTEKVIDPFSGEVVPPEFLEQALAAYADRGITPEVIPPRSLFNVEIRKVTPERKLNFRVLQPEKCKVDGNTTDFTLKTADYFEYEEETTLSDLRQAGFDVPDDIESDREMESEEGEARNTPYDINDSDNQGVDPSLRIVTARYIWMRYDNDGDGIAEMQKVLRVGSEIFLHESASRIAVASIVPFLNTHRHIGSSVADLVFDIQRIKTAILRAGLDSLYLSTRPRHAVSERVNLDDLMVSTPGAPVRIDGGGLPGEGHITPLQTEFVFPQAQAGLAHMDTVTEARVGVTRQFQGIDQSASNDYNRIQQLNTMAAQRVEQIARIFSYGVAQVFSLAHELLIKEGHAAETARINGEWVQIDPSTWRSGRDINIVAPFSSGDRDSLLNRLMSLAPIMEKAAQMGIVTPQNVYDYGLEISQAADVQGQKFFTDPAKIPQPEPEPDYTMLALEVEKQKADNSESDSQRDAAVKAAEIESDERTKEFVARLNSETQIALAQIKAGQAVDLERFKADLKNAPVEMGNQAIANTADVVSQLNEAVAASIQQVSDAMAELKEVADAPREVVRDSDGRVTGVKVNGKLKEVKRDGSGRVTGV